MIEKLRKLQNGTDIRGKNLTKKMVSYIANGFASFIEKNNDSCELKFAIGMDSRRSGPYLKDEFIKTLVKRGHQVFDCSLSTTPAMFMTTVFENYNCDASIMITASHLPSEYNGIKFFTKKGGCEKEDIKEIIELSINHNKSNSDKIGKIYKRDLVNDYSNYLVNLIRSDINSTNNYNKPLEGLKIIVDAGNGSGGFFASKVLEELGANTNGSQYLDPDGSFPNHIPNPEHKEAMNSIRDAVLSNHADLGIIFDTDVDRAAIVSSDGLEINKNSLIALISAIVLEENPNSTIVTDSITSSGLKEFIEDLNGVHHRFKRGYKNVINESKKLNKEGIESYLAIETSGHAALKENYFLDDGAYLVSKILIKMAKLKDENKDINSLIENLKQPKESKEIRISIQSEAFKEYGLKILSELKLYINKIQGWKLSTPNYEGVKICCDKNSGDGWFLLRLSLHEPVLVLNIECDQEGGVKIIYSKLNEFMKQFDKLCIN